MFAEFLSRLRFVAALVSLVAISACGGGGSSGSNSPGAGEGGGDPELPTVSATSVDTLSIGGADYNALRNTTQVMRWNYYMDQTRYLWYISYAGGPDEMYDAYYLSGFSSSGKNGWGTVGNAVATVNLQSQLVQVDPNLDTDPSDEYFDVGWGEWTTNSFIHEARQLIQGTTVPIMWYFFKAESNGLWYIVVAPPYTSNAGNVLKFSAKNGANGLEYDWIPVDGLTASFFMDAGQKKVRFDQGSLWNLYWPMTGSVTQPTSGGHKGTDIWSSVVVSMGASTSDPDYSAYNWILNGTRTPTIYRGGNVYAAASGVAHLRKGAQGGRYIVIDHGCDYKSRYLHLYSQADIDGTYVTSGAFIGVEGNTGTTEGTTGKHLHFEFFLDSDGDDMPDNEWYSTPAGAASVTQGQVIPGWLFSCE